MEKLNLIIISDRNLSDAALSLSLQEEHSDVIFYCEGTNNIVFAHKVGNKNPEDNAKLAN